MGSDLSVAWLLSNVWCHSAVNLSPALTYPLNEYILMGRGVRTWTYLDDVLREGSPKRIRAKCISIWYA